MAAHFQVYSIGQVNTTASLVELQIELHNMMYGSSCDGK